MVTRRQVVTGVGATGVALLGGAGYWRVSKLPRTAAAPWSLDSAPPADVRLDAFRHAILAPNPHNRQPWLIKLGGESDALLMCDLARRLPETDPFDRQITIGFGTFIELARIAAAERGQLMNMALFPEGEPSQRLDRRPVARLSFRSASGVPRDPLYAQIVRRRSTKEVFDRRPPDRALLKSIEPEGVATSVDPRLLSRVRAAIVDAMTIETATRRTYLESVRLMRIGHREIDASPDGIDLRGPMIEGLQALGQISRETLADLATTAYKSGMDMLRETYGSVPGLMWITTCGNTRADQIEAGRRYVRANLAATALGLSMHPVSQSLQEYVEVADPYARVHQMLGAGSGRVQMLARIGYGPAVAPSPRWPLQTHVVA